MIHKKVSLLLVVCFVQSYTMDTVNSYLGPRSKATKIGINYEGIPEELRDRLKSARESRDKELEEQLEKEKDSEFSHKKLWDAQIQVERLKAERQEFITCTLQKEEGHKLDLQRNEALTIELQKKIDALEAQMLELMNDQGYLLAQEQIRVSHTQINGQDETATEKLVKTIAAQKEHISFLNRQITLLENGLVNPQVRDIRTYDSVELERLKHIKEIECLEASALIQKQEAATIEDARKKGNQGFWQYIRRPEIVASALSTAVVTIPLIIKIFRDMRSSKGPLLNRREMLELQSKELSNKKASLEVAAAEGDLIKKVMEQKKEMMQLATTKRKLKAAAWLTDLAAIEADGKSLTSAQLAKKKRCIEELEIIKSAALAHTDQSKEKLFADSASAAA